MASDRSSCVIEVLDGSLESAAVGAAMELGLFWLLDSQPLDGAGVGRALGIPRQRCELWLRLLVKSGLVERSAEGFAPTDQARRAVLGTYSQPTWALLAEEARERRAALGNFPRRLVETAPDRSALTYVSRMLDDPERARRFTRMLYELHGPLAAELAASFDLAGARRVLDLGGGSGVVSMALARRYPRLEITVFDIATVCAAGRAIVAENGLEERVTYVVGDLRRDPLPAGCDAVIECDVGVYEESLFGRVRDCLEPNGHFLIVDQLARAGGPPAHLVWAMLASLDDPAYVPDTAEGVVELLQAAGIPLRVPRTHPAVGCRWTVLRGSVLGGGSAISSVATANQWLRCPATDPEGYRCVRFLSHQGAHQWRRCAWTDPEGYRCFLPPSHPGDHELAWFARPTPPGTTRTIRYHGTPESAAAQADGDAPELAFHDWFPVSQTYVSGAWGTWAWVLAYLTVVLLIGIAVLVYMRATTPAGELFVVYEYRPSTPTRASAAVPAPVAPVGAVRPKDDTTTCP